MRKVGLFGGTFNPVHYGHLNLALELRERGGLDQVWWIPTPCSPLRMEYVPVSAEQRLKMVELAIEGIPSFKTLDIEIREPPPVYTIDTVKKLQAAHSETQFYLILGQDFIGNFMAWKEPLDLVRRIPLLIGSRTTTPPLLSALPEEIEAEIEKGIIEIPLLDISSTQIRERIKKRLYVGHLLPSKVLDFISVNQLYFIV